MTLGYIKTDKTWTMHWLLKPYCEFYKNERGFDLKQTGISTFEFQHPLWENNPLVYVKSSGNKEEFNKRISVFPKSGWAG